MRVSPLVSLDFGDILICLCKIDDLDCLAGLDIAVAVCGILIERLGTTYLPEVSSD